MIASLRRPFFKFLLLAILVWLIVRTSDQFVRFEWALEYLRIAEAFYLSHPLKSVIIFCLSHLMASLFSIPGGCTILNIGAGAIFGFWMAVMIIYPVTMLSAMISYFVARAFSSSWPIKNYEIQIQSIAARLESLDPILLVALRLSPLLPFGVLNLVIGSLRLSFGTYFFTTLVGIFFDVTLLSSIGSGLRTTADERYFFPWGLVASFLGVYLAFLLAIKFLRQYNEKSRVEMT